MTDKPLAEMYYEKLLEGENPLVTLTNFFSALSGILDISKKEFQMFGKLVKIYGATNVYLSLLDCADMESINWNKSYGLLVYFCKKRLATKYLSLKDDDLTYMVDNYHKLMNEAKPLIIKQDPFEEE